MITLRPAQREILQYRRGKMGISAVPGSGKTFTLSLLAAQIVANPLMGWLGDRWSHRSVMAIGMVAAALSAGMALWAPSVGWLTMLGIMPPFWLPPLGQLPLFWF